MATSRVDTKQLNSQVDMVELAGRYTTLHRESSREMSGPCPKCGGDDRFHVHADGWFFCRECHKGHGGAIDFTMWLNEVDFITAVNILQGNLGAPAPVRRQVTSKPTRPAGDVGVWRQREEPHLERSRHRLCGTLGEMDKAGAPGRVYLIKERGLTGDTCRTWALGYDPAVKVQGSDHKAGAVVLPWYDIDGNLVAVQNRYLQAQHGNKTKYTPGSTPRGHLYGEHMMDPGKSRTLVICEGEMNCLSVWQVAAQTGVDVVSIGSKGGRIPDRLLATIAQYAAVVVWTDEAADSRRVAAELPPGKVQMMKSPNREDANDLLRQGTLGKYLCEARLRLCRDDHERMELLHELRGGGEVDAWTAKYIHWLVGELGIKEV